ncbi:MAG: DUF1634 domain-containing protein [Syntrophothermus sp.]
MASTKKQVPDNANSQVYRLARPVLLIGITASFTLILAGFARYALEPGQQTLASLGRAVPFRQLFFLLAQGRPEALLSLGILVLLFVPAGFVAASVAAFCGRGERLSAVTSGIVLAILLISAIMGLL